MSEGPVKNLQLEPALWSELLGGPHAETEGSRLQHHRWRAEDTKRKLTWVGRDESGGLCTGQGGGGEDNDGETSEEHDAGEYCAVIVV